MPTLLIPATVTGWGIYTTFTSFGDSIPVDPATSVSTDDREGSYMRQQVVVTSGSTGYNDHLMFPATSIPGEVTDVSLVTVTKGVDSKVNSGSGAAFLITTGPPDYNVRYWLDIFYDGSEPDDEGWLTIVTPLIWEGEQAVTKAMLEAGDVEYNPGYALLTDSVSATFGPAAFDSRWSYIALQVTYEGGEVPELRGWGRPKARGRGNNTAQGSSRGWGAVV